MADVKEMLSKKRRKYDKDDKTRFIIQIHSTSGRVKRHSRLKEILVVWGNCNIHVWSNVSTTHLGKCKIINYLVTYIVN